MSDNQPGQTELFACRALLMRNAFSEYRSWFYWQDISSSVFPRFSAATGLGDTFRMVIYNPNLHDVEFDQGDVLLQVLKMDGA